jgi:uncharacterized repeat protein (TIGR03803 family)
MGGAFNTGVLFKLSLGGALTVLHDFLNGSHDGFYPYSGMLLASDGNIYGTTTAGGTTGCGTLFRVTPEDVYSTIYNFDCVHGQNPESIPIQHTNGKIYSMTAQGGVAGLGVIYSLDLGLAPFVSLVNNWGTVGRTVQILGQGFTGATDVSFNGIPASFTVRSDTFLGATIPAGATTGFITVTTPSGTLTSNKQFIVRP